MNSTEPNNKKLGKLSGQIEVIIPYAPHTRCGAPYCEFEPDQQSDHEAQKINGYEVTDCGYPEHHPTYRHGVLLRD